jgi:hypothetical protein
LVSGVVGNPGIPHIDTDALRGYRCPASCLSDTKNPVGLQFFGGFQKEFAGFSENCGDLFFGQRPCANGIREQLNGFPGGVDGFTAEGVKAGNQ